MSSFKIFKKNISFLESADRYHETMVRCVEAMNLAETDFLEFYKTRGNIRSVLEQYEGAAALIINIRAIEPLFKTLPDIGIYDVTEKVFAEECLNVNEVYDAFEPIAEEFDAIEEELELEREYRAERKESRGQFVGGGFGLGGAIKGAVTAGALNMATGIGHSIANAVGNAGSEWAAGSAKERLYCSDETYNTLCKGVRYAVWDTFTEYMMFVNQYFDDDDLYFTNNAFDKERATAFFDNAKNIPEKREELLVEALRLCPYYAEILEYIFQQYPSERRAVCDMAEFFHVDIAECYEHSFENEFSAADKSDENNLLAVREKIVSEMENYGIQSSETLIKLDNCYLDVVFKRHYVGKMPGDRQVAINLIHDFDTEARIKSQFIKKNCIWELCQEYRIALLNADRIDTVIKEYKALVKANASEQNIETTIKSLLTALGFKSAEEKERLFFELCDKQSYEKPVVQIAIEKKEKLLSDLMTGLSAGLLVGEKNSPPLLHLDCRIGEANKHAEDLEYVELESGEYVLLIYKEMLDKESYKKGLVLTDKRLAYNGDKGAIEIRVGDIIGFSGGGFLSDGITISTIKKSLTVDFKWVASQKVFAKGLEETVESLEKMQGELSEIDRKLQADIKKQRMQCVQENEFLVRCFEMQARAEEIMAEGSAVKEACERQEIEQMMNEVIPSGVASIVATWVRLCNSSYNKNYYATCLETLHKYLMEIVEKAESVACLEKVAQSLPKIAEYCAKEKIDAIRESIENRRDEAARLDEQGRQKKIVLDIWNNCKLSDLASVVGTWDGFRQSECESVYYQEYITQLKTAICDLLEQTVTISETEKFRDFLSENNVQEYNEYIKAAEEKITALDVAQRTYKGIVFDTVEDIAFAKEEEKKLDIIMRMVSSDDKESIENAIQKISECTSEIKRLYLDKLNGYIDSIATQEKSFQGIVYETPELAERAKAVYVAIRDIMNNVVWDSEQSVADAYERIREMDHPITEDSLGRLKGRLDDIDIQKRTVDDILFDSIEQAEVAKKELSYVQSRMIALKEDDESAMIAIKEEISTCTTEIKNKYLLAVESKLAAYDVRVRTFRGVVYDTREEAERYRQEEAEIGCIMRSVNADDETSLLTALEKLNALDSFLKDNPIATLRQLLDEYDVKVRTVDGVTYGTRQEAELVASEIRRAAEIMQTVLADNEQSILNAQQEILKLTTFVKDARYEELNRMWNAYDERMRTYLNIVFSTRNQAQKAQTEHIEFLKRFNSADLSQRRSLTELKDFIEDRIPAELKQRSLQMVNEVENVLDSIDYIIKRDAEINMATQKKESADLYKNIEAILPAMTSYKMNTEQMLQLKNKHYASLNAASKLFGFLKSKF